MKAEALKTPFKDLMEKALSDYNEASRLAHHWNSDIPKAIREYYHNLESQPEPPKTDPLQGGDQKDTSSINFICNHSFTTPESGYVFCIKCKKQFTLDINTPFFGNSGAKIPVEQPKEVEGRKT